MMMDKCLKDQVAIVTGGNSGIGRATSIKLARMGAKVMIIGRTEEKNEDTKKFIEADGGYAECYAVDVINKDQIDAAVELIYKRHNRIDILISNAGSATPPVFATKMPIEDWDYVMKTQLYGAFHFVQACGEKMKERKYGRIVLMSSLAGVFGLTGNINYAAAKSGLVAMTYSLAKEMGPFGITVNTVQPGVIRTALTSNIIKVAEESFAQATPVKKIGEPEDVAHAIAFFCMPESSYISGVAMPIDGGYVLQCSMDDLMMGPCMGQ